MAKYKWASSEAKLQRAIDVSTKNGDASEEAVRKLYVAYGGLLLETEQEVSTETETPVEAPKKRTRKSKTDEE